MRCKFAILQIALSRDRILCERFFQKSLQTLSTR